MTWETVLYYLLTFMMGMLVGGIMVHCFTGNEE